MASSAITTDILDDIERRLNILLTKERENFDNGLLKRINLKKNINEEE